MEVPSGPGCLFSEEKDAGMVSIRSKRVGSRLDEGRACRRVEKGEGSRKKIHVDWQRMSVPRPFPRTGRVTITHQQDGKENIHVSFYPANSWAWRASCFIPNSPGFEVVGGHVSAVGHVGFPSGHQVTGPA